MLNREQVDVAAKAVIAPHQDGQNEDARETAARLRHQDSNRRAARWGVVFALIGGILGHVVADRGFVGVIAGFGAGSIIGRWLVGRRA